MGYQGDHLSDSLAEAVWPDRFQGVSRTSVTITGSLFTGVNAVTVGGKLGWVTMVATPIATTRRGRRLTA